jgi:sugar transferase (PEP-CTERM/EpsH1 system associated)
MKLFVILSRVPYPLEKGDKLRAYHQLLELKKHNEIVLCCLTDTDVAEGANEALKQICNEYHIFKLKKWRIYFNLLLCVFSRKPFQVMYFYQKWVHKAIRAMIQNAAPDHIYCQLIRTAEYVKDAYNYPKTIDYQDAFSKGMERRMNKASWPISELYAAERKRLIAYENIIFEYFEGKTIISEEDRKYIYHPERKDIALITNGIDTEHFKNHDLNREKKYDILFTGNMNYAPNIETAEFIVLKVLPLLKKEMPQIRLALAGSDPHRRVINLGKVPGVTVTGWMDDIRDAYSSSSVFFAPMQIGTGLQNKLLEAMAMELPCITSTLANKALNASTHSEIIVADTQGECAMWILKLLKNDSLRNEIGKNGREFVRSNFSWEASATQLQALMLAQNSRTVV